MEGFPGHWKLQGWGFPVTKKPFFGEGGPPFEVLTKCFGDGFLVITPTGPQQALGSHFVGVEHGSPSGFSQHLGGG